MGTVRGDGVTGLGLFFSVLPSRRLNQPLAPTRPAILFGFSGISPTVGPAVVTVPGDAPG